MSTRSKIESLEAIVAKVQAHRESGKRVALTNGVFDLLHVGHIRYLEGARAIADVLVVAVNSDLSTRRNKGPDRPIIPEAERAELVAALACVDHVLLFDDPDVRRVIRALRPDVQVKGTDYTAATIPERDEVEAYGGTVAVAGDPKNHSTTELVRRHFAPPTQRGDAPMPLKPELKEVLACPQCKGSLRFEEEEIHCLKCKLIYDVKDGIPVMLVEEARPLGSK